MLPRLALALAAASAASAADSPARAANVLAVDDGCADSVTCGVGLLQHRALDPASEKHATELVQDGTSRRRPAFKCPPTLCTTTTTTTTTRPLAMELVHKVYTYGAPATHKHPFVNAARKDGCFGGLRSYTEDLVGAFSEIHQVDAAAMNNYYPHATTPSVVLHWDEDSYYTPCGELLDTQKYGRPAWPQRGGQVYEEWRLHQEDDYTDRLNEVTVDGKKVADDEPFATARKFVVVAFKSYDTTKNTKAAIHEKLPEWRLVEKIVDVNGQDKDPVMLIQNQDNLECAIVFTGTNDLGELSTSTTQYGTGYCGYQNVHVGYRNELWTITNNLFWKLRPSMERCSRMTCVGHSLGGALCELFAACANSGNYTDPDYQLLAWTPGKPELMPTYRAEAGDEDE